MRQRYYALDVFRGATVALMILVNNPGSWSHLFSPLKHAPWHGCTPTDLVFPFFLFAVGNALSFVMPGFEQRSTAHFLQKVWKRSLLIFGIGLFLNWFPFIKWSDVGLIPKYWVDPANTASGIRILGVLQRIAIAYLLASLIIYFFSVRGSFVMSVVILLGYWFACFAGNPADPYSVEGWFGTAIDKNILGVAHMYKGEGFPFDPEGLVSAIPAIVSVMMGYFVGQFIQLKGRSYEMLTQLFVVGSLLVFTGYMWDFSFPINKKIWTSSYVLYTAGLATLLLGLLIYVLEMRAVKPRWSRFFEVFGKNPLFIFAFSVLLPRSLALVRWPDHVDEQGKTVYSTALPWFYEHLCKPLSSDLRIGSFVYAVCMMVFMWSIVWAMDRKKWYLKV